MADYDFPNWNWGPLTITDVDALLRRLCENGAQVCLEQIEEDFSDETSALYLSYDDDGSVYIQGTVFGFEVELFRISFLDTIKKELEVQEIESVIKLRTVLQTAVELCTKHLDQEVQRQTEID